MATINIEKLTDDLRRDEGVKKHAYRDHLGYLTIGVGRLIDERRGGGLSDHEIDFLLQNDIDRVIGALTYRIPFYTELSEARQRALANMAFQMGINGLLRFSKMLEAMRIGHFDRAYIEALDSDWATQTPERAKRIAKMIKSG